MADIITVQIEIDDKKAVKQTKAFKRKAIKAGGEGGDGFGKGFVGGVSGQLKRLGPLIAAAFSVAAVIDAVREFTNFEKALVGVGKTTDLTKKQLASFGDTLQELSERIPLSATELANLAETAGRFGIRGSKNLKVFTETLAKLQVTTDLIGEEGAESLAKILGITREAPQNIKVLGAVIVDLGNNFRTSESQIVSAANEVARATTQFRLTSAQVAATAAALKDLGARSEGAGTAVGKSFRVIEKAIRNGGVALNQFIELTGLSADELKKTFAEDAFEVFRLFIKGLNRVEKSGKSLTATLESLKLSQDRTIKVLAPLATGYDRLQSAIDRANAQVKNATALEIEASKAFDTLGSDLIRAGSAFRNLANDIVEQFSPKLRQATKDVTAFFQRLSEGFKATRGDELARINIQIGALQDKIGEIKKAGGLVTDFREFLGLSGPNIAAQIQPLQEELTNLLVTRLNLVRERAGREGNQIGKEIGNGISSGINESVTTTIALSLQQMADQIRTVTQDEISGIIFPNFVVNIAKDLKKLTAIVRVETQRIASAFKSAFVRGIGNSFAAFGSALVQGENGLKALGKSVLSTLGSLAIQVGQFFILVGVGMSAVGTFLGLSGGAAIAAGIALTALGGVLKAVGGATEAPAVGGGGMMAPTDDAKAPTGGVKGPFVPGEELEGGGRRTEIIINVEGVAAIGDKRDLATAIAEVIKDGIASNDIGLALA